MFLSVVNLARVPSQQSRWNPEQAAASIEVIRREAEKFANEAISWYYEKKRSKDVASQCVAGSIIFISADRLMPVLGSVAIIARAGPGLSDCGYVLLGIGATFIGLDKFFGFSSAWTRYSLTAQSIQKTFYSLEIDWTKLQARLDNRTRQQNDIEEFLQTAKGLYESILSQVTQETQQWPSEFQQSISDLEAMTKAKAKSSEPGALVVTISGAEELDSQPEVMIDEVSYGHVDGGSWAVSKIAPGQHAVRVVSSSNGRRVPATDVVSVSPGGKALIALSLA